MLEISASTPLFNKFVSRKRHATRRLENSWVKNWERGRQKNNRQERLWESGVGWKNTCTHYNMAGIWTDVELQKMLRFLHILLPWLGMGRQLTWKQHFNVSYPKMLKGSYLQDCHHKHIHRTHIWTSAAKESYITLYKLVAVGFWLSSISFIHSLLIRLLFYYFYKSWSCITSFPLYCICHYKV